MGRAIKIVVIIGLIGGAAAYFGLIRESAIIHSTPNGTYAMRVPRTYLMTKTDKQEAPSQWGSMAVVSRSAAKLGNGAVGFALMHFTMPEQAARGRATEEILAGGLQGIGATTGAKMGPSRSVQYEGNAGLETTFDGTFRGVEIHGRIRVYRIGQDVVCLMAMGDTPSYKDDKDCVRYLDTFSFTPPGQELMLAPEPEKGSPEEKESGPQTEPQKIEVAQAAPVQTVLSGDPKDMKGKTLETVKSLIGRPKGEMKKGNRVVWLYDGFQVVSEDGRTVSSVEDSTK